MNGRKKKIFSIKIIHQFENIPIYSNFFYNNSKNYKFYE